MLHSILAIVLNIILIGNIFYVVWTDKFSAVLVFLITLVMLWRVHVVGKNKVLLTSASVLQYVVFPLIYLLSYLDSTESKIIVGVLYLPVVFKLVPKIMDTLYFEPANEGGKEIKIKEDVNYYTNLIYLYATPILLFQELSFAYSLLGVYGLLYVFGLEKYILRPIPLWERILHVVGLSSALLLVAISV